MEQPDLTMRCAKCGALNRLPTAHCKVCGAKLDFDSAERQIAEVPKPTVQQKVQAAVKAAVAGVLLVVVLLMIWPAKLARTTGEEIDAKRYRLKTELLIDALNRETATTQTIEEKEINAHLRELVAMQPAAGGMAAHLADAGVRLAVRRATVFVAIGRGPFTFTGTFYARPKGARMVVTGAKMGHLPLPGFLGKIYAATQSGLFQQLNGEARILRNLDGVALDEGTLELTTKAGN